MIGQGVRNKRNGIRTFILGMCTSHHRLETWPFIPVVFLLMYLRQL